MAKNEYKTISVPVSLWKKLKIACAAEDMTIGEFINSSYEKWATEGLDKVNDAIYGTVMDITEQEHLL